MRCSLFVLLGAFALPAATSKVSPMSEADLDLAELERRGYIVAEDGSGDWQDISVGMMMERSAVPGTSLTSLHERSLLAPPQPSGLQTRDGEKMEVLLQRNANGSLKLPRNWEEAKKLVKRGGEKALGHIKRNSRVSRRFSAIITWYTGHDLLNPACVQNSNWHPTDRSLVTALTIDWPGQPKCGAFIKIKAPGSNKSVIVRHVDSCGGCAAGSKHCDLTLRAFAAIAAISRGKLTGLQAQVVPSPVKKWNANAIALYGPQNL